MQFLLQEPLSPVLVGCYSAYATAFTCTGLSRLEAGEEEEEEEKCSFLISDHKNVFIPEASLFSLGPTGRYSAHAMASHAQDCPGWKLERNLLTNILVPESAIFLALVRQHCPDWGPDIYVYNIIV